MQKVHFCWSLTFLKYLNIRSEYYWMLCLEVMMRWHADCRNVNSQTTELHSRFNPVEDVVVALDAALRGYS